MRTVMMKKKTCCMLVFLCIALLLAGCGGSPAAAPEEEIAPAEDLLTPVIGARTLEDGRKVGGSAKAEIGETITNVFFSFSVNHAALVDEYSGEKAERGFLFLVTEITVTNTSEEELPMWDSDFAVQWGDGENDYSYPYTRFADTQMEDAFTLAPQETLTADVVYEILLQEGENEYSISYLEYYDDEVEGNIFYVQFTI